MTCLSAQTQDLDPSPAKPGPCHQPNPQISAHMSGAALRLQVGRGRGIRLFPPIQSVWGRPFSDVGWVVLGGLRPFPPCGGRPFWGVGWVVLGVSACFRHLAASFRHLAANFRHLGAGRFGGVGWVVLGVSACFRHLAASFRHLAANFRHLGAGRFWGLGGWFWGLRPVPPHLLGPTTPNPATRPPTNQPPATSFWVPANPRTSTQSRVGRVGSGQSRVFFWQTTCWVTCQDPSLNHPKPIIMSTPAQHHEHQPAFVA